MIRRPRSFVAAIAAASGALTLVTSAPLAWAQQGPTDQGAPPPGGPPPSAAPAPGAMTTTTVGSVYGAVAPPPPGQPVGGGNATESSARPVTGDKEDNFDLAPGAGNGNTVFGGGSNPVFFENQPQGTPMGPPPATHVVLKGETLWAICDQNFRNPYQWPRIWSYNPQIQNPHWIYPNEQIRLKAGAPLSAAGPAVAMPEEAGGLGLSRRQRVPADTVFLRDQGFVNDDASLNWGSIVGSPQDKMFLTDGDQTYVRAAVGHDVKVGQELTVFRPVRAVSDGQVIAIQGTLRVDEWNPETRIARAQVIETLDTIERGARVGPMNRRFEVVAPKRNEADVTAHVAVAVHPHVIYGQNQVVFIDQGAEAGLQSGNRLFVVRHGDAWRKSMVTDQTARRIVGENEDHAVVENTPRLRDEQALPEEVIAELRVLDVQKKSATCLVTQSRREIEPNELAIARKGY